ncbi:hypothetical protein M9434_004890 [Picochlorum sp. BPE23]|nr:hypothetical protein M9434_004890 [Picochlorum sp. BPE23]
MVAFKDLSNIRRFSRKPPFNLLYLLIPVVFLMGEIRRAPTGVRYASEQKTRQMDVTIKFKPEPPAAGLCNQIYTWIGALALANQISANVYINVPAWSRRGWGADASWTEESPKSLFDIKSMISRSCQKRTKLVTKLNSKCPIVKIRIPRPVDVQEAAEFLLNQLAKIPNIPCCILDVGNTFGLQLYRHPQVAFESLQSLVFNSNVESEASLIVSRLSNFCGVHLRLECDASWSCGEQLQNEYTKIIRKVVNCGREATRCSTLYVASGMDSNHAASLVLGACNSSSFEIVQKDTILSKQRLGKYNSEQLALIDLLVLRKSSIFIGNWHSTFTLLLDRMRNPLMKTIYVQQDGEVDVVTSYTF